MKKIISIEATLLFIGCNSSTSNKTTDNPSAGKSAPTPETESVTSGGTFASEISVTLTGGANASTYHVTTQDITYSYELIRENSFGNPYSEKGKDDNELSSV